MAKILIVDDDEQFALNLARELKAQGHACAVQHVAKGVCELARKQPLDLLVLDIMLPDVSGFEVCRSIRRDPALCTLPILMVSAMHDPEEVQHGLAQGADDYITKPFSMREFLQRVEQLLAENAGVTHIDSLTGLPDRHGVRRELQRRIINNESFALIYTELHQLREFGELTGVKGREKATRHAARALKHWGADYAGDPFFAGHMGGGHFMCLSPVEKSRGFCKRVSEAWTEHLEGLYESLGKSEAYQEAVSSEASAGPMPSLLFYLAKRQGKDPVTSQQLLDIVSHIRNNSEGKTGGKIYVDRRVYSLEQV